MKEKIRTHSFNKKFNITLKTTKEKYTGSTIDVIQHAAKILEEYDGLNIIMTLRQLYYQLVGRGFIPNDDVMYGKLSKLLTDARYSGLLDWDMMEDRTRSSTRHAQWEKIADMVKAVIAEYRKARWEGQPEHIEIMSEKEALYSVLEPLADKWHVYLSINRGFSSATLAYTLARRAQEYLDEGKEVRFLYVGDHDPSGLAMVHDLQSRIPEFLEYWNADVDMFTFEPVALTMEQVEQYQPPKNPAKQTDSRFKEYEKIYGESSWEVDALRPDVLRQIVEDTLQHHVVVADYNTIIEEEEREKAVLRHFLTTLN